MILEQKIENIALSNVVTTSEFKIKNSAKAFGILSSGLYSNKIRAIVRELSCNALDSHVAAGRGDVPFRIKLPTILAPNFSIRDFGTGLSDAQVLSVYTTYFESTKTDSNDYIGALGLGSKTPFSYTDNFSVTSYKDGKVGIYAAFIGDDGTPSISTMYMGDTTEQNGLEICFSVNKQSDFRDFAYECAHVLKHFKVKPEVTGSTNFKFEEDVYEMTDIIPGVHRRKMSYQVDSFVVMGNIEYRINIPNSNLLFGDCAYLLASSLVMHFEIGELDFQASREGLSYIPSTVAAILDKVKRVDDALYKMVETEANGIENIWERTVYLSNKTPLFANVIKKYVAATNLKTYNSSTVSWMKVNNTIEFVTDDIAEYNVKLSEFLLTGKNNLSYKNSAPIVDFATKKTHFRIRINLKTKFYINEKKTSGNILAKYDAKGSRTGWVYILEPIDYSKPMDTVGFFDSIYNPPARNIFNTDSLEKRPTKVKESNDKTAKLLKRPDKYGYRNCNMWQFQSRVEVAPLPPAIRYYVKLVRDSFKSKNESSYFDDISLLKTVLDTIPSFNGIEIYGMSANCIKSISDNPNWIDLEDHITKTLSVVDDDWVKSLVYQNHNASLMIKKLMKFNQDNTYNLGESSLFELAREHFKCVDEQIVKNYNFNMSVLYKTYCKIQGFDLHEKMTSSSHALMLDALCEKYPMLKHITPYQEISKDFFDYINLIDNS